MLKTTAGSNDGKVSQAFTAGRIYKCPEEISENLVGIFLQIKVAEKYVSPEAVKKRAELEQKFQKKDAGVAPQNKAAKAPEKKSILNRKRK